MLFFSSLVIFMITMFTFIARNYYYTSSILLKSLFFSTTKKKTYFLKKIYLKKHKHKSAYFHSFWNFTFEAFFELYEKIHLIFLLIKRKLGKYL